MKNNTKTEWKQVVLPQQLTIIKNKMPISQRMHLKIAWDKEKFLCVHHVYSSMISQEYPHALAAEVD